MFSNPIPSLKGLTALYGRLTGEAPKPTHESASKERAEADWSAIGKWAALTAATGFFVHRLLSIIVETEGVDGSVEERQERAKADKFIGEEIIPELSFRAEIEPHLESISPTEAIKAFLHGELGREPTNRDVTEIAEAWKKASVGNHSYNSPPSLAYEKVFGGKSPIFQIYTEEFLDGIAQQIERLSEEFEERTGRKPRIAEIGAGDGRLSKGLHRRDIAIKATDNYSWEVHSDVARMSATEAAANADIIVASWVPHEPMLDSDLPSFDLDVAKIVASNPNRSLILIGTHAVAFESGAYNTLTGSFEFWNYMRSNEALAQRVPKGMGEGELRSRVDFLAAMDDFNPQSEVRVITHKEGEGKGAKTPDMPTAGAPNALAISAAEEINSKNSEKTTTDIFILEDIIPELSFRSEIERHLNTLSPSEALNAFLRGQLDREPTNSDMEELIEAWHCMHPYSDSPPAVAYRNVFKGQNPIYQIYTKELIDGIAQQILNLSDELEQRTGRRPRIVEIAAGDGRLTKALHKRGIDIAATDDNSWSLSGDVERMDGIEAAQKADIVLASWLPKKSPLDLEVLKIVAADTDKSFILIGGQNMGGGNITGSDAFWEYLQSNSALTRTVPDGMGTLDTYSMLEIKRAMGDNPDSTEVNVIRHRRAAPVFTMPIDPLNALAMSAAEEMARMPAGEKAAAGAKAVHGALEGAKVPHALDPKTGVHNLPKLPGGGKGRMR